MINRNLKFSDESRFPLIRIIYLTVAQSVHGRDTATQIRQFKWMWRTKQISHDLSLRYVSEGNPTLQQALRPVSFRLVTSQFKTIVNHAQKSESLYWFKILLKFQRCFLKFHTKFRTHTPVWKVLRIIISFSYDSLNLSETSSGVVLVEDVTCTVW